MPSYIDLGSNERVRGQVSAKPIVSEGALDGHFYRMSAPTSPHGWSTPHLPGKRSFTRRHKKSLHFAEKYCKVKAIGM
ncbi:MAG: hypothetical protein AAGN35_20590 [Bacteroidota bacterium]